MGGSSLPACGRREHDDRCFVAGVEGGEGEAGMEHASMAEHVVENSRSGTVGKEQSVGSRKEHSRMEQGGLQREELGMGSSASSQSPADAPLCWHRGERK